MEEKLSALSSPSSYIEPINATPLRWYPPFALAHQSGVSQASASSFSVASSNQSSLEQRKDSEIMLFGVRIKVTNSDSSLSLATFDDHHPLVGNQNQPQVKKHDEGSSCDSRKRVRLFGVWISDEETGSENKKLRSQETSSKLIKKRAYTRRLFKKRAVNEQNGEGRAGSYKENIGELVAEKVLTKSDIDQSSRLLLSRETVEKRLIPILNENYPQAEEHCKSLDGLRMEIFDADTDYQNGNSYTLVLKQWVTKSFVFTGNWKKDFVKRRNLKEDDQVGIFWDHNQRRFSFSVKQIRS